MGEIRKNVTVASFTGAWIETFRIFRSKKIDSSHPLRVRGLKLDEFSQGIQNMSVASFTGAWIETRLTIVAASLPRRILYGCVD